MKFWKPAEFCFYSKNKREGSVFNLGYRNGNCLCLQADSRTVGEMFSERVVVN